MGRRSGSAALRLASEEGIGPPLDAERGARSDPWLRRVQFIDDLPPLPEPSPTGPGREGGGTTPYLEDRARSEAELGIDSLVAPELEAAEDLLDAIALPRAEAEEVEVPAYLQRSLGLEGPTTFRGWIENSFSGNPANPPDGFKFATFPDYQANRWQGNQYYLIVERLPERSDEAGLGYRVDTLFGNDWSFSKAYGFADEAFDPGQFSGVDIPQFFGVLHLPIFTERGLEIRGGRWYSPAGFEAVQAIERPLFSVSNLMTFMPFTFFGMLGTQHLDDRTALYLGSVNCWDRFINANYRWNTLAGLTWDSADGRTKVSAFTVIGPNQLPFFPSSRSTFLPVGVRTSSEVEGLANFGYDRSPRFYASFVLIREWSDRLTQAMEVAWVLDRNTPLMRGPGSRSTGARGTRENTEWYGFANWFLYEFDPKLTAVWRAEVFWDDDGVLLGAPDTYYEMTLGLITKPRPWFWVRPEIRFDWARTGTPFDAGRSGSQLTINFDAILLY